MKSKLLLILCSLSVCYSVFADQGEPQPVIIGLDADMSSGAALGGESIRRGVILAINEINAAGGVLGRQLELVVRDHRGIPARGKDNIVEFAAMDSLLAVVGGVHTPVALAELDLLHEHQIIYLDPWAAGTPIIDNGFKPNYAFRVSVRDQDAGGFLVKEVVKQGYKKPALFLEKTGWGRSNRKALESALAGYDLSPSTVEWFHWGLQSFEDELTAAHLKKSDVIILVANAKEGVQLIKDLASLPVADRLPVISHWGITGGDFFESVKNELSKVDLKFLQTYSFFAPTFSEKNARLMENYFQSFLPSLTHPDATFISAPAGTAHAYDLVHLLALAVKQAGSVNRPKVRDALEEIEDYHGLVKLYKPPFSPDRHDALDASDFRLCKYDKNGSIVPVEK